MCKQIILDLMGLMLLFMFLLGGCQNQQSSPKPVGYHRIEFPQKSYTRYQSECPYSFEYPEYGKVVKDTGGQTQPCWINVKFPGYDGALHISYKQVTDNLDKYIEDSRELAYKHTVKAEAIEEQFYKKTREDVYGILYRIKGDVASSVQFFLTDSSRHFLRGALYFRTEPDKDSLAPVIKFFKKDVVHLIETFRWESSELN